MFCWEILRFFRCDVFLLLLSMSVGAVFAIRLPSMLELCARIFSVATIGSNKLHALRCGKLLRFNWPHSPYWCLCGGQVRDGRRKRLYGLLGWGLPERDGQVNL